ncbi:Transcriptional regulator [Bacillus velezensis]|nr:protein of unknown function [Bacillus velezensis UCMB5033]
MKKKNTQQIHLLLFGASVDNPITGLIKRRGIKPVSMVLLDICDTGFICR